MSCGNNPWILTQIEKEIFDTSHTMTRSEVLHAYADYVARELTTGTPLNRTTRNILGIFHGQPGAKEYRRYLSEHIYRPGSGVEIIAHAMQVVGCEM